jgi:hypothetical protein
MLLKALLALALTFGMAGVFAAQENDPVPHCLPCR